MEEENKAPQNTADFSMYVLVSRERQAKKHESNNFVFLRVFRVKSHETCPYNIRVRCAERPHRLLRGTQVTAGRGRQGGCSFP